VAASVVLAIVGDVIPYERRGHGMGVIMTAFSLASILGLPLGLILTGQFSWHAPFLALVGLGLVILFIAWRTLPSLPAHSHADGHEAWDQMRTILTHPNHLWAFALMAALAAQSALIYPYLTPSMVTNANLPESAMSLIYLFGGAATLLTSPYFGKMADRLGKLRVFTWLVIISAVPTIIIVYIAPMPVWVILIITTNYMIFTSGRFVPAMAMITASVEPRYRGGFMSVNSSVQSIAGGVASSAAAILVTSDAQGRIVGFQRAGWLSLATIVASVFLIRHLRVAGASPSAPPVVAEPTV
jgi:predicted MFS family arabinose efflux permease